MVSLFGGGGRIKNKKLEGEVKKIDKDIEELFKEFREPAAVLWHPHNLEKATNLIKRILKDIEQYKKLLKSYSLNLNNFPEINQLENSINNFLKILEETYTWMHKLHHTTVLDPIVQKIKMELHKIHDFWNKHKYELHKLGIIK
jgi:predicted translin family RNA/ssDNA-binding protein